MRTIRTNSRLLSIGVASAMLLGTVGMAAPVTSVPPIEEAPEILKDIYFSEEDCSSCKYITVYDQDNRLLYDGLVPDKDEIKDQALNELINDSDYIMSNEITDYYILSK